MITNALLDLFSLKPEKASKQNALAPLIYTLIQKLSFKKERKFSVLKEKENLSILKWKYFSVYEKANI